MPLRIPFSLRAFWRMSSGPPALEKNSCKTVRGGNFTDPKAELKRIRALQGARAKKHHYLAKLKVENRVSARNNKQKIVFRDGGFQFV